MPEESSGQVTQLLQHWVRGDEKALHDLIPVVYQELRRLARSHLQSERPNHTLQSTALVNEAFVRLLGAQPLELQNRAHFVAVASRLMRQVLVDYLATADAMRALGVSLAHGNRYAEADKLFRQMLEQNSDPDFRASMWYSYACAAAVAQDTDSALRYLHEAIRAGYSEVDKLSLDADLRGMRDNPDFQQLVVALRAPSGSVVRIQP